MACVARCDPCKSKWSDLGLAIETFFANQIKKNQMKIPHVLKIRYGSIEGEEKINIHCNR